MSLHCKKCGTETDLVAEGLCLSCYRAMGYDSNFEKKIEKEVPTITTENASKQSMQNNFVSTKEHQGLHLDEEAAQDNFEEDKYTLEKKDSVYSAVAEKLKEDKEKQLKRGFFTLLKERTTIFVEVLERSKTVSFGIVFVGAVSYTHLTLPTN